MPGAFLLLLAAQFASGLADNALLIVTIALLQSQGMPAWWAPLLKVGFIVSYGVLAPFVGKLVDRGHPRPIVGFGFSAMAIALTWLSIEMTPTTPIWRLLLPFLLMGVGMAFIWSPLAATATRNLAPHLAGAGSGVYNTTRQVGGVLGSAGMAALMTSQISSALPPELDPGVGQGAVTRLPGFLHEPFSVALSQSLLLPAFVSLFGVIAAMFLRGFGGGSAAASNRLSEARSYVEPDYFLDDDDYVEYAVEWSSLEEDAEWDEPVRAVQRHADALARDPVVADESVTTPLAAHVEHPLHPPAETWHGGPVHTWHSMMDDDPDTVPELIAITDPYRPSEPIPARNGHAPWHSILDDLLDDPRSPSNSVREPIEFAHNGFHVEAETRLRVPPTPPSVPAPRSGRHSRDESRGDGDAGTYGRHSMRFRD